MMDIYFQSTRTHQLPTIKQNIFLFQSPKQSKLKLQVYSYTVGVGLRFVIEQFIKFAERLKNYNKSNSLNLAQPSEWIINKY